MADRNVRIVVEAITKGQANLKGLGGALDEIGQRARRLGDAFKEGFGNQLSSQLGGIGDAISALPGPLGIVAGAAALAGTAMVKLGLDTVAAAIEFDKLSQKTGASVEFLSGMGAAVRDADVNIETFNAGLVKFADNLTRTVGPTANVQDELFKLADRFAQMPDGAQKTALAIDAFGRSGAELIPILNEGSAGLRTLMADASAAGRVMSQETVAAAKALDDQIDKLNARVEGLKLSLGQGVVPALLGVFEAADKLGAEFDLVAIAAEQNALALQKMVEGANMSAEASDRLAKLQQVLDKSVTEGAVAAQRLYVELFKMPSAANAAGTAVGISGQQAIVAAGNWLNAAGQIQQASAIIAGAGGKGINVKQALEAGRLKTRAIADSARARDAFIQENRAASAGVTAQQRAAAAAAARTAGYRQLYDQIQSNVSANDRYGKSWDDLTAKLGGGGGAIQKIDEQLKSLEDRARTVQGALGGGSATFSKNEKLQTAYAIATGELTAEQFQLQQAIKAVVAANEAGALSTEQALTAALSASQGLASVQDLFTLAGDAGKPFADSAAEIVAAVGKATTKIADMKTAIETLPAGVAVDIAATIKNMDTVRELRGQLEYLDQHDRHTITIDVVYRTTGQAPPTDKPPGYAAGGTAYGWAWVGERGPELVFFGQPSRVFSNTQSEQIAAGGGAGGAGVSVVVNVAEVNNGADINSLAWRVADEIQKRRRNG
jgi:hypothetical protein